MPYPLRQSAFALVLCLSGAILSGCVQNGFAVNTGSASSRSPAEGGTPLAGQIGPDGKPVQTEMPPDMMQLPSLPVPPGSEVLLGDTVIIGDDDRWTGQVVLFTDGYSLVQLVEFMRQSMPNYGWEETAIVRSKRTSINYVRDERFATVRVMPLTEGIEIDIVVAPLQKRRR